MEFSLEPNIFFHVAGIPITDVTSATLFVTLLLGTLFVLVGHRAKVIPGRWQIAFEFLAEYVLDQVERGVGNKKTARLFLPLFLTLLLFIMVANQLVLLPFIMQVMLDGEPLLRTPTTTLAGPIGLSFTIILLANVMALRISPLTHALRFFPIDVFLKVRSPRDFGFACIEFFIGVMDLISEVAKVISLAARLFGNLFAGEVMIAVIMSLAVWTQFLVPIPFMALSILAGFVQAYVFMLLSIQFVALDMEAADPKNKESLLDALA